MRLHARRLESRALPDLAAERIDSCVSAGQWQACLARQHLDLEAEAALLAFGRGKGLEGAIASLFAGERVNLSEEQAALHWALRAEPDQVSGPAREVRASLDPALELARRLRSGDWCNAAGERFKAIIHTGIGGSDWGPRLLYDAFERERDARFAVRFCASHDPVDWQRAIEGLDPETTLVIGASKSFATEETLCNLGRAGTWLGSAVGEDWPAHMVLVSACEQRVRQWLGSAQGAHILTIPETIGGRFSLWSAVSLIAMMALGPERFQQILAGARHMDTHVREAPLAGNLAMRLALLDYWNATIRRQSMRVVLAYASRLRLLPGWLQQLEMESNGKSVTAQGEMLETLAAPAVWGGEALAGQHSYYQWLHQGRQAVPTEFIVAGSEGLEDGADTGECPALLAQALAQAEVLCNGRSLSEVMQDNPGLDEALARQRVLAGGRPSIMLYTPDLTPESLGELLALYEHRTYLAGHLWEVNSFDQWGVEMGKTVARRLQTGVSPDPVTQNLLRRFGRSA